MTAEIVLLGSSAILLACIYVANRALGKVSLPALLLFLVIKINVCN